MLEILNNPIALTILLIIGFVGILVELIHPGFTVPGVLGLGAFALYFYAHYQGFSAPAIFILGLMFLIMELFTHTFGALGVLGLIAIIVSVLMVAPNLLVGAVALGIAIVVTFIIIWILFRYFGLNPKSNRIILHTEQDNTTGYTSSTGRQDLLGQIGTAVTNLRPAGFAQFGDRREDVVSEGGEVIRAGSKVEVIQVEGPRVVVRKVEE